MRGQRVVVQRLDRLRIAREVLVLEREHRQPRGDVAQPLDGGEGKAGRRHLEGEAFADEPGELGLVLERVDRRRRRRRRCGRAGTPAGRDRVISRSSRRRQRRSHSPRRPRHRTVRPPIFRGRADRARRRQARRSTNCSAGQTYCPPWELTPWQMTTTARGFPSGRHERRKILRPPVPIERFFFKGLRHGCLQSNRNAC